MNQAEIGATRMNKIEEIVAKALAQADGFHPDAVSNDEDSVSAWSLYMDMARAAIQAYEAEKMRDLMAGMLTNEFAADGVVHYVERDKMLANVRAANKWMSDAINRLAERKP